MITLRLATEDDFEFYYRLKCEKDGLYWSGFANKPDYQDLKRFFCNTINNSNKKEARKLYLICEDEEPIGEISIKPDKEEFDMPLTLSEKKRGKNRCSDAFKLGLQMAKEMGLKRLHGRVREDNIASIFNLNVCKVDIGPEYDEVFLESLGRKVKMYHVYKDL